MSVRTVAQVRRKLVVVVAALAIGVVGATPGLVDADDQAGSAGESSHSDGSAATGAETGDAGASGGPADNAEGAGGGSGTAPADAGGGSGQPASDEPAGGTTDGPSGASTESTAGDGSGDDGSGDPESASAIGPDGAGAADGDEPADADADWPDAASDTPTGSAGIDDEHGELGEQHASVDDEPTGPTSSSTAVQESTVVETQVATANTGRNVAVGTGTATTSNGQVSISTGAAAAIGNDEQTEITQEAVTALTGQAAAEIIQISIVFNIGGALASSGSNTASGGGTGGGASSTSTGRAVAIGNDSQTYVTQAGNANAASGHHDSIEQRVLTLQIGVAAADSGNNSIVVTVSDGAGGAATVASGNATAVGNQSDTSIEQIARVVGSGHADLSVEQWATVVNLGVALANTGANQVGEMFAALLADPGSEQFHELFAVLLPALLAMPGDEPGQALAGVSAPPGSLATGTIGTGDAIAIGNRSETHVQQVAVAVASGDGRTDIRQEVVVVNAGAAGANTGGNRTGAGQPGVVGPLAPELVGVVEQLTGHAQSLIGQITAWADGSDTEVESTSLSTWVGDRLIGLEGNLSTTTSSQQTDGGILARIRQLTAVINLGVAMADTGNNIAVSVSGTDGSSAASGGDAGPLDAPMPLAVAVAPADAALAGPLRSTLTTVRDVASIVTGDAEAANSALLIVCLRSNAPDHECLRPPDPPAEEPDDGSTGEPGSGGGEVAPPWLGEPSIEPPAAVAPDDGGVAAAAPSASGDSAAPTGGGSLPATGAGALPLAVLAALLLLVGIVFARVGRRRTT